MSLIRITFTKSLLKFVSERDEEILYRYSSLPRDFKPVFVEWIQEKYPEVYQAWIAQCAKRRLESDG